VLGFIDLVLISKAKMKVKHPVLPSANRVLFNALLSKVYAVLGRQSLGH
jgi:hypothetical protein